MTTKPVTHMYVCFWRPDVLAQMKATNAKGAALCDYIGYVSEMSCSTADVDCGACRHNFIEGMAMGDGSKLTWDEWKAREVAKTFPTLREKAEAAAKSDAGWSTVPGPNPAPGPQADMWATAPKPQVWPGQGDGWGTAPKDDGWSTK